MLVFFSIFFSIYAAINYYIFIRGWQALSIYPHLRILYLIIFLFLSLSYIAAKIFAKAIPGLLYDIILWAGSFWFALMIYFLLAVIMLDVIRLFNWQLNFFPPFVKENYPLTKFIAAAAVILVTVIIVAAGYLNTRNVHVKTLNINLPKGKSAAKQLNAALVSDIHLSPMDNEKFLSKIVGKINSLNPDIILIAGDLFDDHAEILNKRKIGPSLLKLKSKYGAYAITGNHEFINGIESAAAFIQSYNIKLLRDTSILIDSSFYLIGRDDRAKKQFTGLDRKPLEEIVQGVDKAFPSILMDHTPLGLNEAERNGIDLQLSGHTHHGQMFPANLITKMIYEVSWGYLKKGPTQYYVSCGAGTWGPPVRTGSNSEIVNLKINFGD